MANNHLPGDFSGQISGSVASISDRFYGASSGLQLHRACHYGEIFQGPMHDQSQWYADKMHEMGIRQKNISRNHHIAGKCITNSKIIVLMYKQAYS